MKELHLLNEDGEENELDSLKNEINNLKELISQVLNILQNKVEKQGVEQLKSIEMLSEKEKNNFGMNAVGFSTLNKSLW